MWKGSCFSGKMIELTSEYFLAKNKTDWMNINGEGNGYTLQCSCLENPMDRGTWQATLHSVTKRGTWLSDWAGSMNGHQKQKAKWFYVLTWIWTSLELCSFMIILAII